MMVGATSRLRMRRIVVLQLDRIARRVAENHRAKFHDDPELVAGVAARCTEVESGARNVDHILTRTLLPEMSAEFLARMAEGRAIYWAMRTLADGQFLGTCDLSEIDRRHHRAEVGFMLGREAWGHGYALEAMQAVIAFAGAGGVRKLAARTHLGNRRSEVLLEKLGFTEEGLLRGHILKDGDRRDCRLFGLLL